MSKDSGILLLGGALLVGALVWMGAGTKYQVGDILYVAGDVTEHFVVLKIENGQYLLNEGSDPTTGDSAWFSCAYIDSNPDVTKTGHVNI
jgi:hypothetical protein